ncbi:MAG TPA: MFS transporter [Bacteroidia bacterium]|nr:MFS transporter [Bacteroidia bacterium]HNU33398.1 MFS transporter [Bacteroidia bacterium]
MSDKNNKKIINAWAMYDWANSVYSLTIVTAVFPLYYNSVTSAHGNDMLHFLGREYKNTALYSYSLSFSFLLVAFLSPLLSGIADFKGNKKSFLRFFCILGSVSCASLFFFTGLDTLYLGIIAFILASVGWAGSVVYYNAFLPEIATTDMQDKVSAKGFALGYIGSSIQLIINLILIMKPELFAITDSSFAPRFSFLFTGIWWIAFAFITFKHLPERTAQVNYQGNLFNKGFKELLSVFVSLKENALLKTFLISFFFYNMGVQTVMYVASLFGAKELNMKADELIVTVLIIQFVGIAGAYLFSFLSKKFSNATAIIIAVFVWIFICICAYYTYTSMQFYALGFTVGMVMGGIQSLSRSTYSKMLPVTKDHASYFSFYDICDKIGLVLGTASYGLIEEITGNMRNSVIALVSYFLLGLYFLFILSKSLKKANSLT